MAKKKASSSSSANSALIQMQRLANQPQLQLQYHQEQTFS